MVQLNNTTKGKQMEETPITPEDQALDSRFKSLPAFKKVTDEITELKENDALIMDKLGSLEIGQTEIEERLDEGAGQFKALWSKVDSMEKSIDKLSDTFIKGVDDLKKEIFDSKLDAALNQNTKMAQENQELKAKLEKKEDMFWDIKKITIGSVFGVIATGLGIKFWPG